MPVFMGSYFEDIINYSFKVILVILTFTSSNTLQNPSQLMLWEKSQCSTINFNIILKNTILFLFSGRRHHDGRNERHL